MSFEATMRAQGKMTVTPATGTGTIGAALTKMTMSELQQSIEKLRREIAQCNESMKEKEKEREKEKKEKKEKKEDKDKENEKEDAIKNKKRKLAPDSKEDESDEALQKMVSAKKKQKINEQDDHVKSPTKSEHAPVTSISSTGGPTSTPVNTNTNTNIQTKQQPSTYIMSLHGCVVEIPADGNVNNTPAKAPDTKHKRKTDIDGKEWYETMAQYGKIGSAPRSCCC